MNILEYLSATKILWHVSTLWDGWVDLFGKWNV